MESEAAQWGQIYRRLKSEGKPCAPRGLQILEVENFSYSLPPYVRFPNFAARHLNLEYIREEFQWYLGGDPYDLGILQHASIWRNLVLRGRLNSNYGLYVFRKGGLGRKLCRGDAATMLETLGHRRTGVSRPMHSFHPKLEVKLACIQEFNDLSKAKQPWLEAVENVQASDAAIKAVS